MPVRRSERRRRTRRQDDQLAAVTVEQMSQCRAEVNAQVDEVRRSIGPMVEMLGTLKDSIEGLRQRLQLNEQSAAEHRRLLDHVTKGLEGVCKHTQIIEETATRLAEVAPVLNMYRKWIGFRDVNASFGRVIINLAKVAAAFATVWYTFGIVVAGLKRLNEVMAGFWDGLFR